MRPETHHADNGTNIPLSLSRRAKCLLTLVAVLLGITAPLHAAVNVTLAWDANHEPHVAGYRIHYGTSSGIYNETLSTSLATTGTLTHLKPSVLYFIVVTAYTFDGLESAPSEELVFQAPDNQLPTVQLVNPSPGGQFNRGSAISLQANARDTDGSVVRVEYYDGSTKVGESSTAPFSTLWTAAGDGVHHLSAIAYDDDGEGVESTEVVVTVTPLTMRLGPRTNESGMEITIHGAVGRINRVYVSSDLKEWSLLATADNTHGVITVTDPQAVNARRRFYRVTGD